MNCSELKSCGRNDSFPFHASFLISEAQRCSVILNGLVPGGMVGWGIVKAERKREDLIETRGCRVGIVQIFILISVLSIKLHTLETSTVDGKMKEIDEWVEEGHSMRRGTCILFIWLMNLVESRNEGSFFQTKWGIEMRSILTWCTASKTMLMAWDAEKKHPSDAYSNRNNTNK